MCINFINLNQACLKDYFPLPMIDQLVDTIAKFKYLGSLDAYLGYHHILMDLEEEEKIIFVIDIGTFYYKVMPFNLKNTSATY